MFSSFSCSCIPVASVVRQHRGGTAFADARSSGSSSSSSSSFCSSSSFSSSSLQYNSLYVSDRIAVPHTALLSGMTHFAVIALDPVTLQLFLWFVMMMIHDCDECITQCKLFAAGGTDRASTTQDQSEIQNHSASFDEMEEKSAKSSAAFDSSDFDRLLEAASSGGMSDNLDSESGGVLQGVDLQGPTRRLNSTLSSNSTMPVGPVVQHPAQTLTQAMQRLDLKTSSGKAEALRQQRLAAQLTKTPARAMTNGNVMPQTSNEVETEEVMQQFAG